MKQLRESLALALLAVLPFSAFLVTVGTRVIAGPNQAPLTMLAFWKEGLLAILCGMVILEVLGSSKRDHDGIPGFDMLDACIVLLFVLSVIVHRFTHGELRAYIYGFRYDFIPLVAFLIVRRVQWSDAFWKRAFAVLLSVGVLIGLYGIATMMLPVSFFTALGYSDLHSLYLPDAPIAAFQQIGGTGIRRVQSVMSGPNQLGLWLLIPWSIALVSLLRTIPSRKAWIQPLVIFAMLDLVLSLTFSRAAWLSATVIFVIAALRILPRKYALVGIGAVAGIGIVSVGALSFLAPEIVMRAASTRDHLTRPIAAVRMIRDHPIGLGLGAAGPASNRLSDPCVFLEPGADAAWAKDRPQLCVFVGGEQVQPFDSAQGGPPEPCNCPLLPENWYLQLGVELGIAGFLLFLGWTLLALFGLARIDREQFPVFLAFLGISVAALVLHAWEDSAVAYSMMILVAACLPVMGSTGVRARR
ncbi:MAG: hypothetical protein Q7R81_01875 [Candidatus Peregrinibacteria bacterium]|nr:hypothetical protein [Candidatus Peregrinibacteria bacterium]